LSCLLSQRQLNEQKSYQYQRRLETAIREQCIFPQVQTRVNELQEEQKTDVSFRRKEEETLAKEVRLDDLERNLKV